MSSSDAMRHIPKSNQYRIPDPLTAKWLAEVYRRSAHWTRRFRPMAMKFFNHRCQWYGCKQPARDLHHLNYDNLYHETFADVIAYCRYHHTLIHAMPWEPANDNKQIEMCFFDKEIAANDNYQAEKKKRPKSS